MTSRTPADWCAAYGLRLLGEPPRGWRDQYSPGWAARIPIGEFYQRACRSVLAEDFSPHGWLALMDAAHRAEDELRRAGTHWVIQFDRDFGVLYADGEQIRLPGPVVNFTTEPEPVAFDPFRYRPRPDAGNPYMITPREMPKFLIGIRLAPRPPDTFTLVDSSRWLDGAADPLAPGMTCPTCGTACKPGETCTEETDETDENAEH